MLEQIKDAGGSELEGVSHLKPVDFRHAAEVKVDSMTIDELHAAHLQVAFERGWIMALREIATKSGDLETTMRCAELLHKCPSFAESTKEGQ